MPNITPPLLFQLFTIFSFSGRQNIKILLFLVQCKEKEATNPQGIKTYIYFYQNTHTRILFVLFSSPLSPLGQLFADLEKMELEGNFVLLPSMKMGFGLDRGFLVSQRKWVLTTKEVWLRIPRQAKFPSNLRQHLMRCFYCPRGDEHEVKLCRLPQSLRKQPKTFNKDPVTHFHFTQKENRSDSTQIRRQEVTLREEGSSKGLSSHKKRETEINRGFFFLHQKGGRLFFGAIWNPPHHHRALKPLSSVGTNQ